MTASSSSSLSLSPSSPVEKKNVIGIVVHKTDTKAVKTALGCASAFGKKIAGLCHVDPTTANLPTSITTTNHEYFVITSTLATPEAVGTIVAPPANIELPPSAICVSIPKPTAAATAVSASPLTAFVTSYLATHAPDPPLTADQLLSTAPKRSNTYLPLLQLPSDAFTFAAWHTYLCAHPGFFARLASALGVTHVARTNPISASSTIRAPTLHFLHAPATTPTPTTLWVTTTQHGLHQTWAPEHTMFSRGNIVEKARVRSFPATNGTIVDLYAGIGYFTFSYVAAGARCVYAWEINAWSVEGLRRGCTLNGWRVRVVREDEEWTWHTHHTADEDSGIKIVVFHESNEYALTKRGLPPGVAMHVHLGLLPSSRACWGTAATLLTRSGGQAHVHENVGDSAAAIAALKEEVLDTFARTIGTRVECKHVQRVKTFAPGVVHVVFDIASV